MLGISQKTSWRILKLFWELRQFIVQRIRGICVKVRMQQVVCLVCVNSTYGQKFSKCQVELYFESKGAMCSLQQNIIWVYMKSLDKLGLGSWLQPDWPFFYAYAIFIQAPTFQMWFRMKYLLENLHLFIPKSQYIIPFLDILLCISEFEKSRGQS